MNFRDKLILKRDRKLPADLFAPRSIKGTAEIDPRFFVDGRIPLLLPDKAALPRPLFSGGVEKDGEGAFVRHGAAIDFALLNDFLPFVARRMIVPILGELIPITSWGSSLANLLTKTTWNDLRRQTFSKTGFRCEICGTADKLECHELWEYYEPLPDFVAKGACGLQRLVRMMALCDECHETQHLGLANVKGRLSIVQDRIRAYNRWNAAEIDQYCNFISARCERRSAYGWVLDVSRVSHARLVVSNKWKSQDNGFLLANTGSGPSETMILGAPWQRDGVSYPAISPLLAHFENAAPLAAEWKYVAGCLSGSATVFR
ncbi:MAG: hypothetical protein WDO70_04960 [Alphaproteobacteria bacterium]